MADDLTPASTPPLASPIVERTLKRVARNLDESISARRYAESKDLSNSLARASQALDELTDFVADHGDEDDEIALGQQASALKTLERCVAQAVEGVRGDAAPGGVLGNLVEAWGEYSKAAAL